MEHVKIQLTMSRDEYERLDHYQALCRITEKKEFFNTIFTFFAWTQEQKVRGRIIAALELCPDVTYKEIVADAPPAQGAAELSTFMQISMRPEDIKQIDEFQVKCGLKERSELFRLAVDLFCKAVDERQRGKDIVSVDEKHKTYTELQMTALDAVAMRETRH